MSDDSDYTAPCDSVNEQGDRCLVQAWWWLGEVRPHTHRYPPTRKPHQFTDAELAAHEAKVRAEGAKAMREAAYVAVTEAGRVGKLARVDASEGSRIQFALAIEDARDAIRALPVPSTGTENGKACPEHGDRCIGEDCCCSDKHVLAVPEPTGDPQRLCPETCTYTPTNGETGLPFPQVHHHCDLPEGHDGNHNGRTGLFGRLGDGKPDAEVRLSQCDRCPTPTESEEKNDV